ncbi:MAG: hypothetical protein JJU00_07000 [Opitutales bacterium]|nr:hypothetical protein [Opitutales bacterium]
MPFCLTKLDFLQFTRFASLAGFTVVFHAASTVASASVEEGSFAERAEWMIANLRAQTLQPQPTVGRAHLAAAGARLHADPADTEAVQYVADTRPAGQPAFNMPMLANVYLRFADSFSGSQRNAIRDSATSVLNWNEDYTENHRILLWSSLYLFAQTFSGGTWNWEENGETLSLNSVQAMERARGKLLSYGRSLYEMGHNEFLSPSYEGFKIASWLNLHDFAQDAAVREAAAAALIYHTTLLAHASFEEILMPPYSRGSGSPLGRNLNADIQWTTWMLWGTGDPGSGNARTDLTHFFLGFTDWRPEPFLESIARGHVDSPYIFHAQQPFFFSQKPGYMMRTTYRDPRFAVSSGVYRFDPEDLNIPGARQLIDDAQFMIVWDSTQAHRQIMAGDPFWRSASGTGWGDASSPFMQTGQFENTAIVLFDIPDEDPWPELTQWSGARRETPIATAQVRFPAAADYQPGEDDWYFLSDDGIYIAVKTLRPAVYDIRGMMDIRFETLSTRGTNGERWQTGFVFEIATDSEFASLEDFKEAVYANTLEVDWEAWTVSYTGTRGHTLAMTYNTSMDPPDLAVPGVTVNSTAIDFLDWPVMASPFVALEERVLRLHRGNDSLVVDWSGDLPQTRTDGPRSPREGFLRSAHKVDETWHSLDGLGEFVADEFNTWTGRGWIYLLDKGWLYAAETASGDYIYSKDLGWLYASAESLPYVYEMDDGGWIHLHDTTTP